MVTGSDSGQPAPTKCTATDNAKTVLAKRPLFPRRKQRMSLGSAASHLKDRGFPSAHMSSRIEDYAFIGDRQSAALVARNGSIDWLCWPRFDSPACFAALLGRTENGRWRVAPSGRSIRVRRSYRQGTLILETVFETSTGTAKLVDFMPLREGTP